MYIISPFFDVYDLQHSMRDPNRIWERKTETLNIRKKSNENYGMYFESGRYAKMRVEYMYFCGTAYPLFILTPRWGEHDNKVQITTIPSKAIEIAKLYGLNSLNYLYHGDTLEKQFEVLESKIKEELPHIIQMFDKFNHPIGIYSSIGKTLPDSDSKQEVPCHVLTFNPQLLNNYPWQEIDSNVYRFHQLIEQYLSGVIGHFETIPKMVTSTDKDRLIAKGFDAITSFRKMK